MTYHVRMHGRGGEGVKLASRIVSRAGFLAGFVVQDSPLYGAERRGAPIVAFVRLSHLPILERGYVEHPEVVALLDQSLLFNPDAAVLAGVDAASLVLVNSPLSAEDVAVRHGIAGRVVSFDISSLVLEVMGQHVLSAAAAGLVVRATGLAPWSVLEEAVRIELGEAAVTEALIERNVAAARAVFEVAPEMGWGAPPVPQPIGVAAPFEVPRLSARVAAPSIAAPATSASRTTEGWRVFRPTIDLARCTRCLLCFALCPEGAIALDPSNYPVVDYGHCKGCLICSEECPPQAIAEVREEAA
jgi:pyruvate ferredoxin oxidoreductase gamma subunit